MLFDRFVRNEEQNSCIYFVNYYFYFYTGLLTLLQSVDHILFPFLSSDVMTFFLLPGLKKFSFLSINIEEFWTLPSFPFSLPHQPKSSLHALACLSPKLCFLGWSFMNSFVHRSLTPRQMFTVDVWPVRSLSCSCGNCKVKSVFVFACSLVLLGKRRKSWDFANCSFIITRQNTLTETM